MESLDVEKYLEDLASAAPTPGGGAAAALTGAQAAALLSMVLNVTFKKDIDAKVTEFMQDLVEARERFVALGNADANAFNELMKAYALPKSTISETEKRQLAIEAALKAATEVPMQLIRETANLSKMAAHVISLGKRQIMSDAGIAVLLLRTAAKASKYNVMVNLQTLRDPQFKKEIAEELGALLSHIKADAKKLRRLVDDKMNS